jgi:hypothetical protein
MTYDKSSCEENEFKLSSDESEATGAQAQWEPEQQQQKSMICRIFVPIHNIRSKFFYWTQFKGSQIHSIIMISCCLLSNSVNSFKLQIDSL